MIKQNIFGIIVLTVCIIIIYEAIGRLRVKEKFDNTGNVIDTIVNSTNLIDKQFTSVFDTIGATAITMKKDIVTSGKLTAGNISTTGNVSTGSTTLGTTGITSNSITSTGNITSNGTMTAKELTMKSGNVSEVMTATDLKKLKSIKTLAGYVVNGGGTTHLLFEGSYNLNTAADKFNVQANNTWDMAWIFKGWQVEFATGINITGTVVIASNITEDVMRVSTMGKIANKIVSYRMTWIGY